MRSVWLFVCLLVAANVGSAQEEIEPSATVQTVPDVPTDVICATCSCADSVVDCANRGIQSFFTSGDWIGLQKANPITVNLTGNSFPTVTMIATLPIQTLNLSNCQIEKLQNIVFSNLQSLAILDLSYNKIATSALSWRVFGRVPPPSPEQEFITFDDLHSLSLAYNDIHSFPQDLFIAMPNLASLDISGNPLAFIDQVTQSAITSLQYLKELKLASCELDNLPDGLFRRLRRLERLDLSDNRFTTIPSVLSEATNLVYLNLNKNLMVNITQSTAISSLTKLQELRLCRLSKLTSISAGALGGLESLVALHICSNRRLTTIDPDFLMWTDDNLEHYPQLQTLHLQNNNISLINPHFLDRWDKLVDVDFTSNPYTCDCNAQWMLDVLVPLISGSENNDTLKNMFCKKPADFKGLSFASLAALGKVLVCPENEKVSEVPKPHTAIILGIMIGIFATFPIVLVLVLLWRRGFFAKCRRKVIKVEYEDSDDEKEHF